MALRPHFATGLVAITVACGGTTADSPDRVVARLSDPTVAARGLNGVIPIRVGTTMRVGVPVAGNHVIETEAPAGATRLRLSYAVNRSAKPAREVHFVVTTRVDGRWREILADSLATSSTSWHEADLAIPVDAEAFRFTTRTHSGDDVSPVWGSVTWLGPGRVGRSPPNVLVMSLDTLGARSLGAFGADVKTPRIDGFLDEAFSFEHAYAQYGNTLVSHASFFTGLYPINHGTYPESHFLGATSLVESLADAGYLTVAVTEGGYVSAFFFFSRGFDSYDNGGAARITSVSNEAGRTFSKVSKWLSTVGRNARFFLFVHTYKVHSPYLPAGDGSDSKEGIRQIRAIHRHNRGRKLLDAASIARLESLHLREVEQLDVLVGALLDRLKELGLAENTLVLLMADHGDQFGEDGKLEHGESLNNRVLQVPLAFRGPGVKPGTSHTPVSLVDALPTLLDLAGVPVPAGLDGPNLAASVASGAPASAALPVFSELQRVRDGCSQDSPDDECTIEQLAVPTQRFKLITSESDGASALDDLAADPNETIDTRASHPDVVERLQAAADAYRHDALSHENAPARSPDAATQEQLRELGYTDE